MRSLNQTRKAGLLLALCRAAHLHSGQAEGADQVLGLVPEGVVRPQRPHLQVRSMPSRRSRRSMHNITGLSCTAGPGLKAGR